MATAGGISRRRKKKLFEDDLGAPMSCEASCGRLVEAEDLKSLLAVAPSLHYYEY